jgi:hypothetical protein
MIVGVGMVLCVCVYNFVLAKSFALFIMNR